ncbi:MAG: hypothetical protein P8Y00_01305 [Deltaproteobacteria bacterium]
MNTFRKRAFSWAIAASMIFLFAAAGTATENKGSQATSANDVKKETMEALSTLKQYTYQQRDKAVKEMKAVMDNLDTRIDQMQQKIEDNWNKMTQASREKASNTLKSLRKKRNGLSEWYGGMKHSSAKAWNHVKEGFASGYESLTTAFDKAQKEFSSK